MTQFSKQNDLLSIIRILQRDVEALKRRDIRQTAEIDSGFEEWTPPGLSDGDPPAYSPTPNVYGGPGFFGTDWEPIDNHDPVTYEIYIDTVSDFTPSVGNFVAKIDGTGYIIDRLPNGNDLSYDTTYYIKLIATDIDGAAPESDQSSDQLVRLPSDEIQLDGVPPAGSPTPIAEDGIGFISARWTPITNHDPVRYEVHISDDDTFIPSVDTLVADTANTSLVIAKANAAGDPLLYDTDYYVRTIAKDGDGSAPYSTISAAASLMQIETIDIAELAITETLITDEAISTRTIAANAITANEILAGSVAAEEIAANAVVAGKIAANAVTAATVAAGEIVAGKLSVDSIVAGNIQTDAVTATKIIANSIVSDKLVTGTLLAEKIFAKTITAAQIKTGTITADEIFTKTITADKIAVGTITADEINVASIQAATVTAAKIESLTIIAPDIRSASGTGTRTTFNSSGIITYDSSNDPIVTLNSDGIKIMPEGFFEYDPDGPREVSFDGVGGFYAGDFGGSMMVRAADKTATILNSLGSSSFLFSGRVRTGTSTISGNGTRATTLTNISHNVNSFWGTPKIICQVRGGGGLYTTQTSSITSTQFSITVTHIDSGTTWNDDRTVDWIAIAT